MSDKKAFYDKLRTDLNQDTTFPSKYLFKFIVPSSEGAIQQIEDLFDFGGAVINKNVSKTGKFTSVSIQVIMDSADAVIEKYLAAEKIEGIISL
jgi:putative lipoic acid-binding regulatory protein